MGRDPGGPNETNIISIEGLGLQNGLLPIQLLRETCSPDAEKVVRRRSARLASLDNEVKDDNTHQKCIISHEHTNIVTHTKETQKASKSENSFNRHDSSFIKRSRLNEHQHVEYFGESNHQRKLRGIRDEDNQNSACLTGINGARKKRTISDVNTETDESQFQTGSFTDISVESNYNLVLNPFNDSLYTSGISEYDTPSKGKILEAPEYVSDIFQRLYHSEVRFRPTLLIFPLKYPLNIHAIVSDTTYIRTIHTHTTKNQ